MIDGGARPVGDAALGAAPAATPADVELAARFCAGDQGAVAVVRRWVSGAATPYRRSLGPEVDDVEQEVLLALVEALRLGRFEGRSALATYVRRMVLYRCINRGRDRRRRELVSTDDVTLAATGPGPEHETAARQDVRYALKVLARLSAACRELWAMIHEGLTYAEMGDRLGVAPGTLRVRVLRCRKKAVDEWRQVTGEER